MKVYSERGLRFSYPAIMDKEVDLRYIVLNNPQTEDKVEIFLHNKEEIFDDIYDILSFHAQLQCSSFLCECELIRDGVYVNRPNSKELFLSTTFHGRRTHHEWHILIPVGRCVFEVTVSGHSDVDALTNLGGSIIDSMEFDVEEINRIPDEEIKAEMKKYNVTKYPAKPKRFQYTFSPDTFVVLYDSSVEPFSDSHDFSFDITDDKFAKLDQLLALQSFTDTVELPVTFYFNTEPPKKEKEWFHIIEGLLGIPSGKMNITDSLEPVMEIKMVPGVYRVRVYFGGDDDAECWRIHFWPSEAKETNEVTVLKRSPDL
jgi:hypothetical protein